MNFCRDERVNEAARGVFWVGYSATNHLTHQDANMPLRETLAHVSPFRPEADR